MGKKIIQITVDDLEAIHKAFIQAAKNANDQDKETLLWLIGNGSAIITDDGVVHIGFFRLYADSSRLYLYYSPRPERSGMARIAYDAEVIQSKERWEVMPISIIMHHPSG